MKANSSGMKEMQGRLGIAFCCTLRKNFPMYISSFKFLFALQAQMLQQNMHWILWHYYSETEQKCNIKQQWSCWQYASITIHQTKGKDQKLSTQHSIFTWKREERWWIKKRWLNLRLLKAKVRMKVKAKMKMDFQKTERGHFYCNLFS